ncbi:MAG: XisI protein [Alkalinema sp. RL_2_19]|nr:XisI protein [Alkalinema sp. RL_2_19]
MDSLNRQHHSAVMQVLQDYADFLGQDEHTQMVIITDRDHDRYLLVEMGWQGEERIYGTLIHIDIVDDKVWIQQDGTESGVAEDLLNAGVPKSQIVLGFKSAQRRQITDYAIA